MITLISGLTEIKNLGKLNFEVLVLNSFYISLI